MLTDCLCVCYVYATMLLVTVTMSRASGLDGYLVFVHLSVFNLEYIVFTYKPIFTTCTHCLNAIHVNGRKRRSCAGTGLAKENKS